MENGAERLENIPGFLYAAKDLGILKIVCTLTREDRSGSTDVLFDNEADESKESYLTTRSEELGGGLAIKFDCYTKEVPSQFDETDRASFNMLMNIISLHYCKAALKAEIEYSKKYDTESGIPNILGFKDFYAKIEAEGKLDDYVIVYARIKDRSLLHTLFDFSDVKNIIANYARMLNTLVEENEICARAGGEEFYLLIKNAFLAERLEIFTELPVGFELNGEESIYNISLICGAVSCRKDTTLNELMANAAGLIELAGKDGRDDVLYYDESVVRKEVEKSFLEIRMPAALKSGQFVVFFQPKVEVSTRKLVGAEALIRWRRKGKLVSPIDFIPLAEKTGFIRNLDMFVLETTCKLIRNWMDSGKAVVPVSVNFSKVHLRFPNFIDKIINIINKYDVPHEYIEVEFTETAYWDDYLSIKNAIEELKKHGVLVSMDDFGSGYSSLELLRNLDFDILKLDKSIVSNHKDERSLVILRNVMKMAKNLSMTVICEGVENESVLSNLEDMGCDIIQGFYFDKPLPLEDFEDRLDNPVYEK